MANSIGQAYKDKTKRDALGLKVSKGYIAPLGSIYIESGFNIRELDESHIADIALAYNTGKNVPAITVELTERGLKVIDGHHRYMAAELAGLSELKVEEFRGDETDRVLFMIQSSQGKALSPLERAKAYQRLKDNNMSIADIAKQLNRSRSDVKNHLTFMNSGDSIIKAVESGQVGFAAAVEELNRNPEGGQAKIEKAIESGEKVTRTSLKKVAVSNMPVVSEVIAVDVYVNCPKCSNRVDGWTQDPRGLITECSGCGTEFEIHNEADIDII